MAKPTLVQAVASLTAACCAALLAATPAAAADDVAAIRAARAASNAGIAAHDADKATASMSEKTLFIVSGGSLMTGAASMKAAFQGNFAKPDFITYVRTPVKVRVGEGAKVASEEGRWVGRWRDRTFSGVYLARWEKAAFGWGIAAEHYVPLACEGQGCPP